MNETPGNISSAPGPDRGDQLDCILQAFEAAWKSGKRPQIEPFLEHGQSLAPGQLLRELILLEIDRLKMAAQDPPSEETYLRRFPDHAEAVHSAFELLESRRRHEESTLDEDPRPAAEASPGENPQLSSPGKTYDQQQPDQIGRFQIRRLLGKGGFARVYLAYDPDLDVMRALKVPRPDRFQDVQQMESFVQEARTAARLEHDGIVRVYDVQRADQQVYIVQQFIEGESLADALRRARLAPHRIAELLIQVAEAIGYAHRHGFVHRDLKPANILLDTSGLARVADFGLALDERQQRERVGELAGSLLYMSPEQTRRESHRLDGRSDIWSLGVILYELLTGTRPFGGQTRSQIFDEIQNRDPRPPRMLDPSVPRDLSRICLTCLSKRATDRYETTADLVGELRAWMAGTSPGETAAASSVDTATEADRPVRIVPKGLANFEAEDADFFLELLPGPHDRDGLPRSIRLWKSRIEQTEPDKSFRVGLIYGASGCGKSSLVKAGLLPRLDEHVLPVYVESTAADTEVRLLKALRGACPDLSPEDALPDMFRKLREQRGIRRRKVLVVLDQFEQWLHARQMLDDAQLLDALRQCDGSAVQCLVLVRDDFQVAVHEFFRELETHLDDQQNFAVVSRFDLQHAAKVLGMFGVAYGKLPEDPSQWTEDQQRFVSTAVAGLAQDHEVISVRLSVFAEMMSNRSWTEAGLREVGGTERVGVNYLEEKFSSKATNPEHHNHVKAIRAVLKALLPPVGTDIKGQMQSYESLRQACEYHNRADDFERVLRILDHDLRIIKPTEPDRSESRADGEAIGPSEPRYFQLTHDYLVPSVREWLTYKQRESRRGRAELRLEERCSHWTSRPEPRNLPNWWEFLSIWLLTRGRSWTDPQRNMMLQARNLHAKRWGTAAAMLSLAVLIVSAVVLSQQRSHLIETVNAAVNTLQNSRGSEVQYAIRDLQRIRSGQDLVLDELNSRFPKSSGHRKLTLAFALAAYNRVEVPYLIDSVRDAEDQDCMNFVAALTRSARDVVASEVTRQAKLANQQGDWKFKSRLAILAVYLGDVSIAADIHRIDGQPDPTQQTVFIHDVFPRWHDDLQRLAAQLDGTDGLPALQAGMALAVTRLGSLRNARREWQDLLTKWYRTSPSAGTHSSTGWALQHWQMTRPQFQISRDDPRDRDWKVNSVGLTMLRIKRGSFERTEGELKQTVTLSRDLWISDVEISIGLFRQFVNDTDFGGGPENPDRVNEGDGPGDNFPVENIKWLDAILFCNWLSGKEERTPYYEVSDVGDGRHEPQVTNVPDADGYRLPSEAEWEYACRSGTNTEFCFGNELERLPSYGVYQTTHAENTASRMCNRWGLFDVHGNVAEFCADWQAPYESNTVIDPQGPPTGRDKVLRGGHWKLGARGCRSGIRGLCNPNNTYRGVGFRVAHDTAH